MIVRKTDGELELMHQANRIVHEVLDGIAERVGPGMTTSELDSWAEQLIRDPRPELGPRRGRRGCGRRP